MDEARYIIIHGHFYQPPRESPWTGIVAPEPGAAPFANWNERILSECYTSNAHAHIMEGRVVYIRNNYELLNFDFGPTLMNWLERHGKAAYRAVRRGDESSIERCGGHGNAMAQSYSHSILPLLSARDREIQIAWGIDDFVSRFKRRPEGIWLPECAADEDTLKSVAAAGLKFVILGSQQGSFNGADARSAGPFLWSADGLMLAVFRFDQALSAELSFGDMLDDGARMAESIVEAALALAPGAALLLATDGETFGHHNRTGAAELARALAALERREDVKLANCAEYLATHPPAGTFEIDSASSWSCPHGIERWRADCGCQLSEGTSQQWRGPLREAMEFVKNHADSVYDRFAPELVGDPMAALKDSIRTTVDPNPVLREEFFRRHPVNDDVRQERLLRLLEMERAAQATLTSCAWYFDDFGGPEGRVALRWAARAVELAAELVPSAETDLLDRLRQIRSNRRDIADAASLYLSLKTREARGRI